MNLGFGTQPKIIGDEGLDVPLPGSESAAEQISDDIREIRRRYVQPPTFDTIVDQLPSAQTRLYEYQETKLNGFLISVTSGTVNLWFGDYRTNAASSDPHLQFTPVGQPAFIPIPINKGYRFTVFAAGGVEARYCIIPLAL